MKKCNVLFIVSDFLPNRNGGTIRLEKALKFFSGEQFEVRVLTKRYSFKKAEVLNGARVYRTMDLDLVSLGFRVWGWLTDVFCRDKKLSSKKPGSFASSNARRSDNFVVPDTDIFWALGSIIAGIRIVKRDRIDVIYSSAPSSSVHVLGLLVKWFCPTTKWIVEFRDPWTFNPFRNKKPWLLEKFDHVLEKKVLKKADKVIVVSDHFKTLFLEKYHFLSERAIAVIPNGFDMDDFNGLPVGEGIQSGPTHISIVHTGNFYEKRSLVPFLTAFQEVISHLPPSKSVRFTQYGSVDPAAAAYLERFPNPSVELRGAVSHKVSLSAMVHADWLLLVPGPGKGTMTGKIFEYLIAGRPILGLVSEGPARDLLLATQAGICTPAEDCSKIVEILYKIINNELTTKRVNLESEELRVYNRKHIAERISCAILAVLDEG